MTCAIIDEYYLQAIAAVTNVACCYYTGSRFTCFNITLVNNFGRRVGVCWKRASGVLAKPFVLVVATCRPNRPLAFIRLAVQFTHFSFWKIVSR
jgi:hypothetical protein